jgi:hypothetical protein
VGGDILAVAVEVVVVGNEHRGRLYPVHGQRQSMRA